MNDADDVVATELKRLSLWKVRARKTNGWVEMNNRKLYINFYSKSRVVYYSADELITQ